MLVWVWLLGIVVLLSDMNLDSVIMIIWKCCGREYIISVLPVIEIGNLGLIVMVVDRLINMLILVEFVMIVHANNR